MQRHFHEELEALKQTPLAMGGLVEDQIRRAMRALLERDDVIAQEVIDRDRQVNTYDIEVDEQCVNLLALHQPAAGDLRFITTAMKIVTDLERIGDQAVNIAQRVLELKNSYTIVIVTHNMQQAARVSDHTGFMLLGELVEFGVTRQLFTNPREKQTEDYITGRFG